MTAIPDRNQIFADNHLATAEVTPEIGNSSTVSSPKQFDASRYVFRLGDDFMLVKEMHVNFVRLWVISTVLRKIHFFLSNVMKGNKNGHGREICPPDITFYDGYLQYFEAFLSSFFFSFSFCCGCPICSEA